ncbi:hypothetical protein KKD03_00275 [Patescibacteria group bacterium]|nr:hypothetical protein [Patescibacteria group bacterium]
MSKSLKKIKKQLCQHKKYLLLIFLTAGLYFTRIFSKIIFFKNGDLYASHPNVWSDWALHITFTNTFANKPISEWFLYHPYFSGGRLTYPFLTNAISGLLIKLGFSITQAMIWPSILFILLLLIGMYFLNFQILKSSKKSILAIFIFLTSAGPGFINFVKDFYLNPNISNLTFPPIDYTRIVKYQWLAGNIPIAILVPQRAFLFGMTIGIWSLLLLMIAIQQKNSLSSRKLMIISGLLAGILPIAHTHSFIAIVIISGFICISIVYKFIKISRRNKFEMFAFKKFIKNILYFVTPAAILSTILYFSFIHGGIQKIDFMKISFGWTSEKNLMSWITMWWNIWGIMVPLAIYSIRNLILKNKKSKKNISSTQYFYGFFALFIISNIVTFQPTSWDNSKLFSWVYFGFSLLASHIIVELWNKKSRKIVAIVLMIFLSTTGILELIRLQKFDRNTYLLSNLEEIEFAQLVMRNTNTDDIFLTASDHNYPLQMWGSRSIVLGYKGWITNFGFGIEERSKDIIEIYQFPERSLKLIKKYDINYIVIGEREKNEFIVNQKYFNENFPVIFQKKDTNIYKIN